MEIYRYLMPGIDSNMYLLTEGASALVIDPHISSTAMAVMRESCVQMVTVLLTHEHFDHISGVNWLRENFAAEVISTEAAGSALSDPKLNMAKYWEVLLMDKPADKREAGRSVADGNYSCYADRTFSENLQFMWEGHEIHMMSAPGHSPGGALILFDKNTLFSGDNLVNGAGVICRLPGGSRKEYCEKTRPVIDNLPDDTWVFPGHGDPAELSGLRRFSGRFGSV